MSKMNGLDFTIQELRKTAQSLLSVADGLTSLFSSSEESQSAPQAITLEDVRGVLAEKSRSGCTAEVRELLQKHGAEKLSEIDPDKYVALLKDAEAIGNG